MATVSPTEKVMTKIRRPTVSGRKNVSRKPCTEIDENRFSSMIGPSTKPRINGGRGQPYHFIMSPMAVKPMITGKTMVFSWIRYAEIMATGMMMAEIAGNGIRVSLASCPVIARPMIAMMTLPIASVNTMTITRSACCSSICGPGAIP